MHRALHVCFELLAARAVALVTTSIMALAGSRYSSAPVHGQDRRGQSIGHQSVTLGMVLYSYAYIIFK